jgi:PEP-CTERM motif
MMRSILIASISFTALAIASSRADALDLTAAGIADGFTLSEFVSGLGPSGTFGVGPLGMAVNSDGNVIVNDNVGALNYVFKDVDGQTVGNALSSTPNQGFPPAYAFSNGSVWGSTGFSPAGGNPSGALVKLNNDGTVAAVYSNIPVTNGLWTNPVNGHLLGAGNSGIIDIDVSGATPTFRVVTTTGSDGVTVSPDGKTVYNTGVTGFDIATGNIVYGSFSVPEADGMGVISGGKLNGDIVVNSNDGSVYLLDALGNQIIIADDGSRGDYTSPDRTNGSLLLTQSDSIWRLSVAGGSIGGGLTPGVPEPSTWAMLLLGFLGLGRLGNRGKKGRLAAAT